MLGADDFEAFLFDRDMPRPELTYIQSLLPDAWGLELWPVKNAWRPYPEHPPMYKANLVFRQVRAIGLFMESGGAGEPAWYRTLLQDGNGDRRTFMLVESFMFDDLRIWKDGGYALCGTLSDLTWPGGMHMGIRSGIGGKLVDILVVADVIEFAERPLHQVGDVAREWWAYWQDYWRARSSDVPLPYDAYCETTIPLLGALD